MCHLLDGLVVLLFCYLDLRMHPNITEDSGFRCNSRKRLWHIAVAKGWGSFCRDPQQVYDSLKEALQVVDLKATDAFFVTDPAVLEGDMKSVKKTKKKGDTLLDPQLLWSYIIPSFPDEKATSVL